MATFKTLNVLKAYRHPPEIGSINPLPFEVKSGEVITKQYQCVEDIQNVRCCRCSRCFGSHLCSKLYRKDKKNVIFIDITNEKTDNQLNPQDNG